MRKNKQSSVKKSFEDIVKLLLSNVKCGHGEKAN